VRGGVAVVVLALACASGAVSAGGAVMDEYQMKAAFLYSFLKFVQWPQGEGPIVVAVLGDDPFDWRLDQVMKGRTANGREIVVKRARPSDDLTKVHILFVSRSEASRTEAIVARIGQAPVLTVGDTAKFVDDGGMVRLFVDGDRVRFEIGIAAVEQARLKASAQLLSLGIR
jgi:hypothetical protein